MWTKESIKQLLAENDRAVSRAVKAIYDRQTADEQSQETTKHSNGVGFTAFDARRGTYYGDWVTKRGALTGRHLQIARKMMAKYAGQLAEIANANAPVVPVLQSADPGNLEEARLAAHEAGECDCESYDGEMLCPSCQVKQGVHPDAAYGNAFGHHERKQEARAYDDRGSW